MKDGPLKSAKEIQGTVIKVYSWEYSPKIGTSKDKKDNVRHFRKEVHITGFV